MRKEQLHSALAHPELLNEEQLRELRETVDRFPFFGAAQIALSQAYHAGGDHRFTDQLSRAAIYTSNRHTLYELLRTKPEEPLVALGYTIEEEQSTHSTDLASAILEQEEQPIAKAPTVTTEEKESFRTDSQVFHSETEQEITEGAPDSSASSALQLKDMDPLDAQILLGAMHKSIELEVEPEHTSHSETTGEEPLTEEPSSFAALIYRRAQRLSEFNTETNPETPQELGNAEKEQELPAFRATPLSHGIQRIQTQGSKEQQRQLIDRFIRLEPQIAKGKAGEYQSGNLAKESLEDDFSFVTETMAVLFAKQGKLDKARKAFRKLMEQHPEKSIYFASQLKNLDQLKK